VRRFNPCTIRSGEASRLATAAVPKTAEWQRLPGSTPGLSAQGRRSRQGAATGLNPAGRVSAGVRVLRLPLVTTRPVDETSLIRRRRGVQLPGDLPRGAVAELVQAADCKDCNKGYQRDWIAKNRDRTAVNRMWTMSSAPSDHPPGSTPGRRTGHTGRAARQLLPDMPRQAREPLTLALTADQAPLEEAVNSPDSQSGDCGFKSRTEYARQAPIV
jgi:hypothetical protein